MWPIAFSVEDSSEPQQVVQSKSTRLGARQARLPVVRAQDRALAPPEEPNQNLSDDRTADRSQAPPVTEDRCFGENVVPERCVIRARLAANKIAERRRLATSPRSCIDGRVPGGRSQNATPRFQG